MREFIRNYTLLSLSLLMFVTEKCQVRKKYSEIGLESSLNKSFCPIETLKA